MKYSTPVNTLTLNDLRFEVHLGWTDEERAHPQLVEATVLIRFPEAPAACKTDILTDTICYGDLCQKLTESVTTQQFKLIERLAEFLHAQMRSSLAPEYKVQIHLTKIEVPVKNLLGGASFSFGDEF